MQTIENELLYTVGYTSPRQSIKFKFAFPMRFKVCSTQSYKKDEMKI